MNIGAALRLVCTCGRGRCGSPRMERISRCISLRSWPLSRRWIKLERTSLSTEKLENATRVASTKVPHDRRNVIFAKALVNIILARFLRALRISRNIKLEMLFRHKVISCVWVTPITLPPIYTEYHSLMICRCAWVFGVPQLCARLNDNLGMDLTKVGVSGEGQEQFRIRKRG